MTLSNWQFVLLDTTRQSSCRLYVRRLENEDRSRLVQCYCAKLLLWLNLSALHEFCWLFNKNTYICVVYMFLPLAVPSSRRIILISIFVRFCWLLWQTYLYLILYIRPPSLPFFSLPFIHSVSVFVHYTCAYYRIFIVKIVFKLLSLNMQCDATKKNDFKRYNYVKETK